ncbi:hypothetical protein TRFO_42195 [Tritrichomonas foetus]|uniref:Uncharacterized protein n=1 Tax=Tritrichomonas foetus TaxID=1144522 RepID=A0A1J4L1T4_9EUKA|nr:hypothetical protein TRFO_42195 [Tritrichomonas foetus]|eukprot:OHT15910.1 hypothetical protein TRFO_42195 [Tritrichomonas foetus]
MAILGLKTTAPNTMVGPNELDALFSDDSDSGSFSLDFAPAANTLPPPMLKLPLPVTSSEHQIKSMEEALPRITAFLSKLNEISPPKNYIGDIFFIPENAVPVELSSLLSHIHHDEKESDKIESFDQLVANDFSSYPDTVRAQIELLKFTKLSITHKPSSEKLKKPNSDNIQKNEKSKEKKNSKDKKKSKEKESSSENSRESEEVRLEDFLSKKVDSRIISLIHFALSKNQDAKVAVYHLIASIEEMIKFPMMAPISVFYPDYTLSELLKQLAIELVSLFPHNPILPSCIENMSAFSEEAKTALDLIPDSDDETSDDFSSSFFQNIKPSTLSQPVIVLHHLTKDITNLLNFDSECPKSITVVTEPPTMMTFQLDNGDNQMTPTKFKEWIESIRNVEYKDDYISQFMQTREPISFRENLPSEPNVSMISYHLPVLHLLNSVSFKYIDTGAPFKELLKAEYDIQDALSHNNSKILNQSLTYFSSVVPQDESVKIVEKIKPLSKLRTLPSVEQKSNKHLKAVLAVSDFEIAIHGRSLLTLAPICKTLPDVNVSGPISNNHWRSKFLYTFYSKDQYSPYVSFRIAFALALNLIDRNAQMACNFLFEALYVLLQLLPLNMSQLARSTYLLIAEIFDQINAYYYSALTIDNFFLTDVKDATYSTSLGRMATRNNDYLRATYHYTQSLKHYINRKMSDESLYIAQVISTVYAENGLNYLAISLLSAMLYKSYSINFGFVPQNVRQTGTLQSKKTRNAIVKSSSTAFTPDPHSLNTSLLALTLTDLLLSERMFDIARAMLNCIQESRIHIKRLVSYMQSRFLFKQNKFVQFLESIPKFDVNLYRKSNPRLSILSASTFDTNAGYLRMLATMNYSHLMFVDALFWSEIIIHTTCKGSLKEFGYGNIVRGLVLYEMYIRGRCDISAKTLNHLQEPFGKFVSHKNIRRATLLKEALSSFYLARMCFEHVGCFHLCALAGLFFCDLFLIYSFSILDEKSKKTDSSNSSILSNHSLTIKPPVLMTELLNAKESFQIPLSMNEITLTLDTIPPILNSIENIISKSLSPIDIIHFQILQARYNYLKDKTENTIRYFDFAYSNLNKYFVCGCEFIPRFFSLKKQRRIHIILQNMAHLLLRLQPQFINDRLPLFDILNDVRVMVRNTRKTAATLNQTMIAPKIDVLPSFVALSNPNFPDFEPLLRENKLIPNTIEVTEEPTINDHIDQIMANIRLYESEKIHEEDLTRKNRKLCQKIEMTAEIYRRQHQTDLPAETQYSFIVKQSPKMKGVVFVIRIFDKIGIYVPETGEMRTVDMFNKIETISVKTKNDIVHENIGLFNSQFVEFFLTLTSVVTRSKNHARHIQRSIASKMFKGLIHSKPRSVVPDTLIGGNKVFGRSHHGALSTLDCGTNPVIIICSQDLQGLPYETMLKQFFVLRSFSFTRLAFNVPTISEDVKPMMIRSRWEDPARFTIPFDEFLYTFGGELKPSEIDISRSEETIVQPIFFSKETNDYYSHKYKFLNIVDNGKFVSIRTNNLVIYSYSDLCEMPKELERRMKDYKFASFMFIPNAYFKKAMKLIRRIYRGHEKRVKLSTPHKKEVANQLDVVHDRFKHLSTLQATLIDILHIPIPLFMPVA